MRLLVLAGLLASGLAYAERGSVSLTYQQIHIDGFESTVGELDIGTTDTQALIFEVDYALTERLTASVSLPFIRKRYNGGAPHRPETIAPPRDSEFVDDGSWHSDFQDWHVGVQYALNTDPVIIVPFIGYSSPISDYPFFGHAAVGQDIWHFEVGAHLSYSPALSNFYVQFSPSYVFAEETLGQSIDHWRVNLGVGYHLSNRVSGRIFVLAKEGDGLEFPDDFPPPRDTEKWYQHDRLVKHNYVNVGLGLDFLASARNSVSFAVMRMVHADQVHVMKYAASLTLARSF